MVLNGTAERGSKPRRMAAALVVISAATLFGTQPARAFDYNEHREIACEALRRVCLPDRPLSADLASRICTYQCQLGHGLNTSANRNSPLECVGFADLVGVAGDHTRRPTELLEATCTELHNVSVDMQYYLDLAETNVEHFRPESERTYDHWHRLALAKARAAQVYRRDDLLEEALVYEAFALHFLTDSYSAGHQRVDRGLLRDFVAKRLHDQDCRGGLMTTDGYRIFGDGYLRRSSQDLQWNAVVSEAKSSLCEVLVSYDPAGAPACRAAAPTPVNMHPELNEAIEKPFSPYDQTVYLDAGVSMAIEGREFYGYLPQLYVDVTLPRWPSWQVSVVYTPIALENQGAAEHFFRHQAEAFHQLEPGVTLRHSVLPYLDVLASVRYPFILSEHRYLNYPTALVGFDYWIYRLSLGGRFGAAQFPSLESGYRLSAFSSLVVGVGL